MNTFRVSAVLDALASQDLVLGMFLVGAGLVFILLGAHIFKTLISISFGVVGFVIGGLLPVPEGWQLVSELVGAVLLAILSTLVLRLAVALLAGGWAGFATCGLIESFGVRNDQVLLVAGLFACVVAVSLSVIVYREIIVFVTSFEGALLFLGGLVVFLNQNGAAWRHVRTMVIHQPVFGSFVVLAVTVVGFYLQTAQLRQQETGGAV